MAGNDDRRRISPERASDGAGSAGCTDLSGKLAVSQGLARRYVPRLFQHAPLELRQCGEIHGYAGKIPLLSAQQPHHGVDRRSGFGRGGVLYGFWESAG